MQQLQPLLFQKLCAACANLTEHDVKMCTLIRLGLCVGEIELQLSWLDNCYPNRCSILSEKFGLKKVENLALFLMA